MADGLYMLEDESFPSFLGRSLDSTTLGNVSAGPGLPVAASTVAKIRPGCDNRGGADLSYLEGRAMQRRSSHSSVDEQPKFSLSYKDDLDDADDFIAAHRLSNVLVKVNLDESASKSRGSAFTQHRGTTGGWPTEFGTELSTGLLTMTQCGQRNGADAKAFAAAVEDDPGQSEGADSDRFSSNSSFLANEKLMSVDSMTSDDTDEEEVDLNNMPDDELERYFNKLVLPSMQRGRVEGQELSAAGKAGAAEVESGADSTEAEQNRHQFFDAFDEENFQMPNVRLAAAGMDSCPASDEDTEDELQSAQSEVASRAPMLPSTSRHLVGESLHPSFRPGLEGGSSEDEVPNSSSGPTLGGIEERRSAEGRVINAPVAGNGGGADGSSGSEEIGNDGGVSTVAPTTYVALRALGIVGGDPASKDGSQATENRQRPASNGLRHAQMGDRVGPVGTGEISSAGGAQRVPPGFNWSMLSDRQGALDAMEKNATAERLLDSMYFGNGLGIPQDSGAFGGSQLQGSQGSFHLSQILMPGCGNEKEGFDEPDGARISYGLRGGASEKMMVEPPVGYDCAREEEESTADISLEAKYFTRSFIDDQEDSDDAWNQDSEKQALDLQHDANGTHNVVYQNEEGQWVTDLAYYSSFQKELDEKMLKKTEQFQSEDFVPANDALKKIVKDQEEFEKEHQFMQEEQISPAAHNGTFHGDSSWKLPPTGHVLMRASQVAPEFPQTDDSYLRLSLGQFFSQRSEALGSLGKTEADDVKRPSFGYVINSPEKREPFPLITPPKVWPGEPSFHNHTVDLEQADRTLNPEELNSTLNAHPVKISSRGDTDPKPCEPKRNIRNATFIGTPGAGSVSGPEGQSQMSPDPDSSQLLLSISTIATAMANASISMDPTQLAAMITELSKKSRKKPAAESAGGKTDKTPAAPQVKSKNVLMEQPPRITPDEEQRFLMDSLQRSISAGDMSAMLEKYLKGGNISGNSDDSAMQTTFDLSMLAQSLSSLQPTGTPSASKAQEQRTSGISDVTRSPDRLSPRKRTRTQRRSGIPRPCASLGSTKKTSDSLFPSSVSSSLAADKSAVPAQEPGSTAAKTQLTNSPNSQTRAPPDPSQRLSSVNPPAPHRPADLPESKATAASTDATAVCPQTSQLSSSPNSKVSQNPPSSSPGQIVEDSQCNFRPSTSPLTHSSPSQTSIPASNSMPSPSSFKSSAADPSPAADHSPQSVDSPSLSRLTYISMNDGTLLPTPECKKDNSTMALSTTIIRFSPTPPTETDGQANLSGVQQRHATSLDCLPAQQSKCPAAPHASAPAPVSSCNFHSPNGLSTGCRSHKPLSDPAGQIAKVDSGCCSGLSVPVSSSSAALAGAQLWPASSGVPPPSYGAGLGLPSTCTVEGLHYVPVPNFKSQYPGVIDFPHKGEYQSLLTARSLFNPPQQFLNTPAALHAGAFSVGQTGNSGYSVSSTVDDKMSHREQKLSGKPLRKLGIESRDLMVRSGHSVSTIPAAAGSRLPLSRDCQEAGMMGEPCSQYGREPLVTGSLEELKGQVVTPEELRFPHACCVGIASQTSLSLFNPSDRWQQVSITIVSLAINGEKVDSLPYQWLLVKNKTIIAPKTTEEQKVLFIPPRAGVYQCVLSVCSWPASAEAELAARASLFAKSVVLVAIAENPVLEVDTGKSGCLDFGDLPCGSSKSLPLRLLNRTHATVPIRLVITANATAWRCYSFSTHPVSSTCESSEPRGHVSSVMNHVLHASYDENPESFLVWVHFKSHQTHELSQGNLGPAHEYVGRVDVEVDSPGPANIIKSVPLKARTGTARVHAPKDLQTVSLYAPAGKSDQQTLPLKNAGNIEVQLKLKTTDNGDSFSVKPEELTLKVGEERSVVVSFKAFGHRKYKESILTVLVLPSGPQYDVTLTGQVIASESGKPVVSSAPVYNVPPTANIPSILTNKQYVAWGGVTLGRAVQQKLILRNSANTTQQLRLLIRGQDQDCFQLQSMFSPEERLTQHGELSIHPREDVTVHLLFAPTRVACMLAKLDIKQSGVRTSQPGVKFTIPLSGYGGTSNIILEEQRKQVDGYVSTLPDIAVGHVSKVCLSVRNTGSRAAFIKAVAFSDLDSRTLMQPSVLSLAPSQFVLKERTQEVITVLMKSTQREEKLCRSDRAVLASVCLFCGDEVSRQQYRRLLRSKPDAALKTLSKNSLLRDIEFNEKFLGEDIIRETFDLPQRPNEAHIFYINMSKVVVSLVGSARDAEHKAIEPLSTKLRPRGESILANGNVSLDVLPVKGPQGPRLPVSETSPKASHSMNSQSDSWTIHPPQLLLPAPTISGPTVTSQVQIRSHCPRKLSFDLSWPAHCLTVTPQHGTVEPQSHLQILISPNPSLATRQGLLPWSGQIYVQCDGQQKFIKVQIRSDLALDVSAASADKTLSALPAQVATPLPTRPSLGGDTSRSPQARRPLVELRSKNIVFPSTHTGETSDTQLEVLNGNTEVRWYLSSFAPSYVKGVDDSKDVYRTTYTAFRCSRVSGTLGAHEKMQIPFTFLPRDKGDYVQFWDLECHPVGEALHKTKIRFQLSGTGLKFGSPRGPQHGNCYLVKTETTAKSKRKSETISTKSGHDDVLHKGLYTPQDIYTFPDTRVGESTTLKVNIRNNSSDGHELNFVKPREPFHIKHTSYPLRPQHYLKLPVQFKPSSSGRHTGLLLIQSETSGSLVIQLAGEGLP